MNIDLNTMSDAQLDELYRNILDVQRSRIVDEAKAEHDAFVPFFGESGGYFVYVHEAKLTSTRVYYKKLTIHIVPATNYSDGTISISHDWVPESHCWGYDPIDKSVFIEKIGFVFGEINSIVGGM